MAMNQANVPMLLPGIANVTTALFHPTLSGGRSICTQFYGTFEKTGDCQAAIEKLSSKDVTVAYINDGRTGDYHLPTYTREGKATLLHHVSAISDDDYPQAIAWSKSK